MEAPREVRNNSTAFRHLCHSMVFSSASSEVQNTRVLGGFPYRVGYSKAGDSSWGHSAGRLRGSCPVNRKNNSKLYNYLACMAFLDASTDCGGIPSLTRTPQEGKSPTRKACNLPLHMTLIATSGTTCRVLFSRIVALFSVV
jgi:hypothetical protein